MIAYMKGKILKVNQDGILLLAGNVGYEILLPVFLMESINNNPHSTDSQISLFIYYYQTDRQPKPILIGFNSEEEKNFFQAFISVDAIGPLKAVKAMEKSIAQIAIAIENQDFDFLSNLKGIGNRTAQKIVASLHGKVSRFISKISDNEEVNSSESAKFDSGNAHLSFASSKFEVPAPIGVSSSSTQKIFQQVLVVLVEQLGYTNVIAKKMVSMAIDKNPSIATPEELLEAVLHGKL